MITHTNKEYSKKSRAIKSLITLSITLIATGFEVYYESYPLIVKSLSNDHINSIPLFHNSYWLLSAPLFMLLIGLSFTWYFWITKKIKVLTDDAKQEIEKKESEFWSRWYIRYGSVILLLGFVYICYIAWYSNEKVDAKMLLLFNPLTGGLALIMAVFFGWEVSLLIIGLGILYLLFIGISALPTSVAIVIGSLIITYALLYNKNKSN